MRSIFAALLVATTAFAAISKDEVTSLPGWSGALPSAMYSGYLQVRGSGASLHYLFSESEATGSNVPLVLWLNGGPGCSSLDGAFEEQGVFQPDAQGNLSLRATRWTKQAHMLWLEAPVGVGFSYSPDRADYTMNDTSTADDNLAALVAFLKGFPEHANRDFYIAGESYAGVYVPTLANAIVEAGKQGVPGLPKLRGIAVGNGCTGTEVGTCSPYGDEFRFTYMGQHNLFSPQAWAAVNDSCSGDWANPSAACNSALEAASNMIGRINIYNIGANQCIGGAPLSKLRIRSPLLSALERAQASSTDAVGEPGPVACIDSSALTNYLNTPSVVKALHVDVAQQYWQQWQICSDTINYHSTATNLPRDVYPVLVAAGLRVLVFNGDYDACVPVVDNEQWTSQAAQVQNWPVKSDWHPWMSNGQVAGYATDYSTPTGSFTFITVHGSGHMVPQYQPDFAYLMITKYLAGEAF